MESLEDKEGMASLEDMGTAKFCSKKWNVNKIVLQNLGFSFVRVKE